MFMVRNGKFSQWQYFHFLYLPCTHWLLSWQEHSAHDMALCLLYYSCAAVSEVPLMSGSQGQPVTDQCSWRTVCSVMARRQLRPAPRPVSLKFTAQALKWDCYWSWAFSPAAYSMHWNLKQCYFVLYKWPLVSPVSLGGKCRFVCLCTQKTTLSDMLKCDE